MNCQRAYEIDLEDLLAEPESPELREFEAHCEGCASCAGELAMQRGLLARLSDDNVSKCAEAFRRHQQSPIQRI